MRSNVCAFLAILLSTLAAVRAFAAASLTTLGGLPGSTNSIAYGASGDGTVVVGRNYSSGYEAFRWTNGGGMVGLGDLPGGSFLNSWAKGVSGDGSVVVGVSISASDNEAFRWTSSGGIVGLGKLPGAIASVASGVSGDGSTVVGWNAYYNGNYYYEAFYWTADGGMVGLGDLPGGSFYSAALGVSGDGSVIVGYGVTDSGREALSWTSDGGMMGLDSLYDGFNSWNDATGVSGDGSIVIGFSVLGPSGETGAFYWTADSGMRTLWDVLLSHGVEPAADGWTDLYSAAGISADGSTIVGNGMRNGATEAFVAVIPIVSEPLGDFDRDGDVDGGDFLAWQRGDSSNNGSAADLVAWRVNFGLSSSAATGQPTPEPRSAIACVTAFWVCAHIRRR